ncbi:hypothetical protein BF95_10710 [Sphingobium sp. Ant17]|nr:hypothetical protein BF95_10710 [Sphingobium sp. Ant17]
MLQVYGLQYCLEEVDLSQKVVFIIIGLTSLVIGLGLLVPYGSIRDYPWTQVCVIIMCAMQVSFLAEAPRFGWSVPRLLEIMGNGSYSIYLFHMFGVGIGTIILFKVFSQLPVLGIVISAGLGIAIGLIVYHFLEAPMDKWFRRVTADSLFSNRSIRPSESVDRL